MRQLTDRARSTGWTGLLACGLLSLLACDDGPGTGAADLGASGCVEADLVAQCPAGTSPVLGAQAESACSGAVGGVVEDALGQAAGQCYGAGSCRVVCRFDVPCRCGIASITGAGVECASCEGAAACGNGLCEGGETPDNCPVDCGMRCQPDERRCDGETLQACNLQGRWEALACPAGEACSVEAGAAQCARDVEIIGGDDMGVADAGPIIDDSRVIAGPGDWPETVDLSDAERAPGRLSGETFLIRLEDGSISNRPTPFANLMRNLGTPTIRKWWLAADEPALIYGFARHGRVRINTAGELVERVGEAAPVVDEAGFCAAFLACNPAEDAESCAETYAQTRAETADADAYLACAAARLQVDCADPLLACQPTAAAPYAFDGGFFGVDFVRVGDRVLAPNADNTALVVYDLATRTAHTHAPVGNFLLSGQRDAFALSADGRIAAGVARDGDQSLVVLFDVEQGERRAILPQGSGVILRLALSPAGRVLATKMISTGDPATDDVVSVWRVDDEQRIFSLRPPPEGRGRAIGFFGLRLAADGQTMAVDNGATIEIWDLGDAPTQRHVLDPGEPVFSTSQIRFGPDGRTLAIAAQTLGLWNTESGQRTQSFPFGRGSLLDFTFAQDGQRLLLINKDAGLAYYFTVLAP